MSYASELLDGFNEALSEFGTTIHVDGYATPVPVLAVGPEVSVEMMLAGNQPRGTFNFQVARTAATAAGIAPETTFTVAGAAMRYHVLTIEDEPASPILYVSAGEVE